MIAAEHVKTLRIEANGVWFAALEAGEGPLALCLHGFPDTAQSFAPLLHALAAAGYHAVAPYLRGYAPTDISTDGNYRAATLGQDAVALIAALGAGSAVLIGHDWGAVAAYAAATIAPERISRLVTLAVPHGPALLKSLIADPVQQRRSWYMYLLASPMGEAALAHDDFRLIDRLWADWSPGFVVDAAQMDAVKAVFRQPGVAAAATAYYKQVFQPSPEARTGSGTISAPALYLHGSLDGCIGADIEMDSDLFQAGVRTELVQGAGHFLHLEKPDEVNALILNFLK